MCDHIAYCERNELKAEIDRLRAELANARNATTARIAELEGGKAGWEVEGFIDRLTRRDDSNSERLVLEAISHLRGFSLDCDGLRARAERTEARIAELADLVTIHQHSCKLAIARAERAEAELKAIGALK